MANKTYTEVLDTMIPWTEEHRSQLQQMIRYAAHGTVCGLAGEYIQMPDPIAYPNITKEYAPADECKARNLPSNANAQSEFIFNIIGCIFLLHML